MSRIGVDLGGTRIKAGEVDSCGRLRQQLSQSNEAGDDYPRLLSELGQMVRRLAGEADDPVELVGIGSAGVIDIPRGAVRFSPNIRCLSGHSLAGDLKEHLKVPVILDNDANCMALGEGLAGAARGETHFIAVTLGTGIGGAVVSDGRLIRGFDGGGGELGHMPINLDGPSCGCGSRGCLESFIGSEGIFRKLREKLPEQQLDSIKAAQELAVSGNAAAREVFAWVGEILAVGMAGLVNVFGPRIIVIGGGIAAAGDLLFHPFEEALRRRAMKEFTRRLEIHPAELGNWAGVVGAAWLDRLDPQTHWENAE